MSRTICLPIRRAAVNELPISACRSAARGRAALEEPRVGRVHARDLAIERVRVEHLARGLDFEDLGHERSCERAQKFVIAPVSAPCASLAYLARKPLV